MLEKVKGELSLKIKGYLLMYLEDLDQETVLSQSLNNLVEDFGNFLATGTEEGLQSFEQNMEALDEAMHRSKEEE